MTDEQITTCLQEIAFQITSPAAFGGDGAGARLLAMELLDYREARRLSVTKGYNEAGQLSRGMPGTPLTELVQLLPDKAPGRRRPDRRCASCEHWRCLHIPSSPNLGTCVFSYDHLQTNSQLRVLLRDGQYDCDTYRRKRT